MRCAVARRPFERTTTNAVPIVRACAKLYPVREAIALLPSGAVYVSLDMVMT